MRVFWPFLKNFSVFLGFFGQLKATWIARTGVLVTSHVSNPVYVVYIIYGLTHLDPGNETERRQLDRRWSKQR